MNYFRRVWHGLQKHPTRLVPLFLSCYGLIWLFVESLGAYSKEHFGFLQQPQYLFISLLGSALFAVFRNASRSAITLKLPHSNSSITVKFADFFNEHGTKALAVNEYFDSELGAHVSERSLHGQLITKHFGGNSAAFNLAVGDALSTEEGVHVERASGNQTKFPIGTTVSLPVNTDSYILVAMCKTDLKTLKAQADLSTYMAALEGLWEKARATHNGRPVIVPLIGTGLAGIGLPASKMLDLLLLSFVEANKSLEVCQQLVVVLDSNKFADFDLSRTLAAWS